MTKETKTTTEVKEMKSVETVKKVDEQKTVDKASEKAELSREEKKRLRREGMSENGRITMKDEDKETGYRYRLCNVLPGNIENWKSKGYEVVTHNLTSGTGQIEKPECNGRPQEVEVGGAHGSMKAVWMRTTEENAQILDEIRDDLAREQAQMIYKDPIPVGSRAAESPLTQGTNIGKITKENLS